MATVSESNFIKATDLIIKNLEGGYFHPQMMLDGRLKYNPILASSGETMFGIDRKNGAQLKSSQYWAPFWAEIDKAGAKTKWKWNYRGGPLETKLQNLAGLIMLPWFNYLFNKYLSQTSQAIIVNDPALRLHFSYAAWNGEGWFKRFADDFNKKILAGERDIKTLRIAAAATRTQSANQLIKQSGVKVAALMATAAIPFNFMPLLFFFLFP